MMQKILKGDTSGAIAIALADGFDYSNATVEVRYQGAVRVFKNCTAGQTLTFTLTAEETAPMAFGAHPVTVRIVKADGSMLTVTNAGVKIAVTDCVEDVRAGGTFIVDARGGLYGVDDLPAHYTVKDLRAKINEIIAKLGGGVAALCLLACTAFGLGVTEYKATLEDLDASTDKVVTNVTFDASGLATSAEVQRAETRVVEKIIAASNNVMTAADGKYQPKGNYSKFFNGFNALITNVQGFPDIEVFVSYSGNSRSIVFKGIEIDTGVSTNGVFALPFVWRGVVAYRNGDNLLIEANGKIYKIPLLAFSKMTGESVSGAYNVDAYTTLQIDGNTVTNGGAKAYADEKFNTVSAKADQANLYSSGVYQYMIGNTNAWFAETNYVTNAEITNRTHFAWEDGMNAGTVPGSMALWEIRDGQRQRVWDQRDWTAWYWSFKAAQLSNNMARVIGAVADEVSTNCMKRGWAKYTAVRGLDNPDPSSLVVDTPKVQLFAGHQWEKLVETGGAGYWTLTGNGIELSAADATNTFLTVKDFEGNACLTFRKTSSYLVYCECGTDITSNYMDGQGRVVFHITTDVQPTAEFSTTLDLDDFVEQGESGCPANYEWTGSAGNWDCHFLLKPGIVANACFARFKVMRQGDNMVEHTIPIKINGGIIFDHNGQSVKIRPTVTSTAVGSTVNWVVAQ